MYNHPYLDWPRLNIMIYTYFSKLIHNECSICLNKLIIPPLVRCISCDNWFHKKCIKRWILESQTTKCPLCRQNSF